MRSIFQKDWVTKITDGRLLAHYGQGTTTIARCWKIVRKDSTVWGFTNHDSDITFDITYKAATGFIPSAVDSKLSLAVANLEVTGILDSSAITEADVLKGLWDNAQVTIFEVNYADLTMGAMIVASGMLGNVSTGRVGFKAEIRGLAQQLQQPVGAFYTKTCQANFGDSRCRYNVSALSVSGTVDSVSSRAAFGASALTQGADYFGAGVLTWVTGANAGAQMEVTSFNGGQFVLALSMPSNITIGDTFTVLPGCRKRRTQDCVTKWNNVIHFRGFPDVPGNDRVLGAAGVKKA